MPKPKVAFYWCASCGGCEETVVDLAEDILGVVAGAARLPREAIGFINLNDDHSYVDVAADAAEQTVEALDGIKFKGKKLRAKLM